MAGSTFNRQALSCLTLAGTVFFRLPESDRTGRARMLSSLVLDDVLPVEIVLDDLAILRARRDAEGRRRSRRDDPALLDRHPPCAHHIGGKGLRHVGVLVELGEDEREQLAALQLQHHVLHGHGRVHFSSVSNGDPDRIQCIDQP